MVRAIFNPTVNYKPLPPTEQQLRNIFKKFDTNNDNRLSKEELKKAFGYLGSKYPGFRAKRALHHADANRDGFIDEEEMNELIKYAKKAGFTDVGDESLPTAKDAREAQLKEFCEEYAEKGVLSRAEIKIAYQYSKEAELNKLVEDIEQLGYRVQPRNP